VANERPETKHEKFERLRDARLPKITHALDILSNLGGSGYESSEAERRAVVDELQAAVDAVAEQFGVSSARVAEQFDAATAQAVTSKPLTGEELAPKPEKRTTPKPKADPDDDAQPNDPAEGGALAKHEIAWAYDAVQRKDWKLATNRLKRVIDMWRQ